VLGRYVIKVGDGTVIHNYPGYLLRELKEKRE
jgi:hypothetical protein